MSTAASSASPSADKTVGGIDRGSSAPMYDQLRQLILDGIDRDGLQPGDPLPGEHRLCEQYGISRTVVRQALAQLEHEGAIERIKGKGTFVAQPRTSESLVHTLVGLFDEVDRRGGHVRSDVLRHEIVDADAEVTREGQQQLEGRLAPARLQARQRAGRHPRPLGEVVERPAPRAPERAQPRPDLRHLVAHRPTPPSCQFCKVVCHSATGAVD